MSVMMPVRGQSFARKEDTRPESESRCHPVRFAGDARRNAKLRAANAYRIAQIDAKSQQQIVGNGDRLVVELRIGRIQLKGAVEGIAFKVGPLDGYENGNVAARGRHADRFCDARRLDPLGLEVLQRPKIRLGRPQRQTHGNIRGHQRACFA